VKATQKFDDSIKKIMETIDMQK